jgi:hypothetical protein
MASKSRFQRTKAPKGAAKRISCAANASSAPARSAKEMHRTALVALYDNFFATQPHQANFIQGSNIASK